MKRSGLVLFVCLCLQIGAVSAPFMHLHADAEHETGHHDGRLVHGHLGAHEAGHDNDQHHNSDHGSAQSDADQISDAGDTVSVNGSSEPAVVAVGVPLTVSVASVGLAPPARRVEITQPAAPVTPPPVDVGPHLPNPHHPPPASLRGPPR